MIETGEIQLLNYSLNDVSGNLRLPFTELLQLLRVWSEHGAQGMLLRLRAPLATVGSKQLQDPVFSRSVYMAMCKKMLSFLKTVMIFHVGDPACQCKDCNKINN